mmetsp:Transcript_6606/g.16267  ORF Transcript_6606/g.16267 Transcript_6606/m.16267 type:complete len:178 (+) Transcript_6606:270-803(+)|eukprot:CAMPEP_0197189378 /NCGR_PEP_ID=MMETSP1423-20130617/19669_1 /TAXON_ID=476441 /ORGANISM="Pseudo-nitzschia heimii, Strain UNC1101" /LENGTH=177 /DNA_ID=CAMNT_0042641475 /DNA_START=191 /DNA_END=724 /DNA_ORIENTATION=-
MLSAVSFSKVNLWVAILLALTVFSGVCVDKSQAFTAPTVTTHAVVPERRSFSGPSVGTAFSHCTSRLASTVIDSPTKESDTKVEIIKENITEDEKKSGKNGWEIQLFNDPFNHRTFVAKCLCTICGKSDTESYQIMMQAHKNGMGVVGRYHYEIAELYYGSLKEEGLTVRMVEVDDE